MSEFTKQMPVLERRAFLGLAAGFLPLPAPDGRWSIPIIDAHIHLFDTARPEGVPWPPKEDKILYRPALPERYQRIVESTGVVGAIEIEASPWLEDNQWVLDIAAKHPIIVATIGDLEPGKPDFSRHLERFHKNPLFRGIRYGNLWGRNLGARLADPSFVSDLKLLSEADLLLDTANPDAALIQDVVRLTDSVPHLRVVVDHLPHFQPPPDSIARNKYESDLNELGKRPQVYVKISQVLQRVEGRVSHDMSSYRPALDHLWEIFGPNRLIYGSDWPNSDPWGTYTEVLQLVQTYFETKGRAAAERYFWKNSLAAYRWIKRDQRQPETREG